MKRLVLLLMCVAVLACLLAAPVYAGKKTEPLRPTEGTATVWDGWWYEYAGDDAGTWWMCNDPTWEGGQPPWPDYKAVSIDQPIIHFGMWAGVGYGYMRNIPDTLLMTEDVWGPYDQDVPPDPSAPNDPDMLFQQFSAQEVKQFWTGPYEWDDFWSRFSYGCWILEGDLWTPEPFNPRIGAGVYGNDIMLPLGPFTEPVRRRADAAVCPGAAGRRGLRRRHLRRHHRLLALPGGCSQAGLRSLHVHLGVGLRCRRP